RGDRQATIEGSQPEHKRCAYKLNPGRRRVRGMILRLRCFRRIVPRLCGATGVVGATGMAEFRGFRGSGVKGKEG
ncbi:hypothetical protein PMQ82_08475, partial [Bifidobacterium longum]|nr:hypothetical protein [Bifidobacterium longum]MDB6720922.1 hypothetical protein [Bifidobacterium longum]